MPSSSKFGHIVVRNNLDNRTNVWDDLFFGEHNKQKKKVFRNIGMVCLTVTTCGGPAADSDRRSRK
ncbi:MAG: hypothetical protein O4861_16855 [Trichodesmium sp. St16_bin4-tuft]|uniref:hypothetical protein n=1 Tax=Trichodesmium erythraeum TaxID=1206 RepID=UPI00003C9C1A|nr:hypothetical protein [Trichodesmium erythraeum GBRTRLIN201]MCH2049446.1 hypothetical protein [Trichodesmium sp. ALOHA_ZT_67]MCL2929476.1 hypothetical protein [Trichodesmium sp. MAG_R01]MDE5090376.1 hypothetical protein [Trichodesmium sp. St18_bin3_1_1]MDE5095139.1 hypothetical protein [Trichodesmium sp. St11_bin5]MDE5099905.1 hypothetical protein [Trichodesmium sp. St16_bin4-tuft]MDT9339924.1 hypothetical protein [Trichodesmium erythraeum 21-75]